MTTTAIINLDLPGPIISRQVYGHFAEHLGRCVYGGFWVGEDGGVPNVRGIRADVVEALRALRIPNLRWPGGCFADTTYHVFEMSTGHHDAASLDVHLRDVPTVESDGRELGLVSVTASTKDDGALVSLANLDIDSSAEVVLDLRGRTAQCRGARILTAPTPASHNTPQTPCAVAPAAFDGVREHPRGLLVELPPHSYLTAELQLT